MVHVHRMLSLLPRILVGAYESLYTSMAWHLYLLIQCSARFEGASQCYTMEPTVIIGRVSRPIGRRRFHIIRLCGMSISGTMAAISNVGE